MTDKHTFNVQDRTLVGKKVKRLRREGTGVGSISTPNGKSKSIQFDQKLFSKMIDTVGESSLLYLTVSEESKERPVLIDEIQYNPVLEDMIHVTFRQVSLKEKVTAEIPVELTGEVDVSGTTLVVVRDMIEIEALPTDLPEKIIVDISVLTEAGQSISIADLNVDKAKVTIVLGEDQEAESTPVVILQEVQEEVEEVEETAVAEGEEAAETTEKAEESSEEATE
jgi:large subunit ribosomal protein L25